MSAELLVLLFEGARRLTAGQEENGALSPAQAQVIAAASEGVVRAAAEAFIAAYELSCVVELAKVRAAERVGRTQASVPVLLRQLDQVSAKHDMLLNRLFELQDRARPGDAPHIAQLERIIADQTASLSGTLVRVLAL